MTEKKDEGRIILVDKPMTWTSFHVVKKLRYALNVKKIGHSGTLDPLATGLLILCTGPMTKKIESFQAMEKEYTGEIVIGKTTASYDLETEVEHVSDTAHITEKDIAEAVKQFTGNIMQVPPRFSAIKINGKRAYKSARKGEMPEMKPRPVLISAFDVERLDSERLAFRVICSKGTYIRSLAHDLGKALGTGAYLASLRRTRIGTFHVDQAQTIEELTVK